MTGGTAGPQGPSALHTAVLGGDEGLVEQLLRNGADPAATVAGVPGSTPLSFALFYAHSSIARVLDAAGRAPNDLRSAAGLDDVASLDRLIRTDGSLEPEAAAGMPFTAPIDAFPPRTGPIDDRLTLDESLTWACRNGAMAAIAHLVERGAGVNANPYRGTPLLWAVFADRADVARWLLDHGADPDLRHDFGGAEHGHQATALHLAAQFGALDCLDVLLEVGADTTIQDASFNATPRQWAEHNGEHRSVARLDRG